ncbi:MAG TPA: hypothetical protein VH394_24435 [Thermoanaerobaculia bacterium]|jgi:hypothetical protein|nr:hypothetical protein [Thermoanaerobaculia bacterium]
MNGPLWVVGGEQKRTLLDQNEWNRFRTAVVTRVDPETGSFERVLEHRTPPGRCPDDQPSHIFKAATVDGDTMWLCTQTEVLECALPGFEIRRVISLPCFNDLHHVTPGPDGTLFVAVTGLDAVAEVSREGELVRLTSVLGGDVWERFDRNIDYRKVPTTKPHRSHPNYVFFLDGRPWVTRFEQRDAAPLDLSEDPFRIEIQGVHDGHVNGGKLIFTAVNGHVVTFDLESGERCAVDLNRLMEPDDDRPLGWCRGLHASEDGRLAWVGFSKLRPTKLKQNLSWLRNGFKETARLPTRIALYDLERPARLREIDLEPAGLNAIFSIHPAS